MSIFERGGKPLRIGYGRIFHEANAYAPGATEFADVARLHYLSGPALAQATTLRGTELRAFFPHAELTGFRQAARLAGGIDAIPLISAFAMPSAPLSRRCFDEVLADLLASIHEAQRDAPLDGIYLALHGSMQVHELGEAPEAVVLRAVRGVLRPEARVAVSYDLHANLSAGLVEPADIVIAYRSNPHWDLAPTGFRAGNRLIRTLRGYVTPTSAWRKLPMLFGGGMTIDFLPPMRGVFKFLKALEKRPGVLAASLFMVHPYTHAEHLGWAVHVTTDNHPQLAEQLADELAERVWTERHKKMPPLRPADEALDHAARSPWRKLGPITLVDVDDVVGAGAPGGNTRIVAELVRNPRALRAYVPVHDPRLVEALWEAPTDRQHDVVLRGSPGYDAPEVPLTATIGHRAHTDFGRAVRLDVGPFFVVITEHAPLPIHPSFWSNLGLSARKADVIVQKNFFHYRMFYATTSFQHVPVVTSGATSFTHVHKLPYRVAMHPLHQVDDWRPGDRALRAMVGWGEAGAAPTPPADGT